MEYSLVLFVSMVIATAAGRIHVSFQDKTVVLTCPEIPTKWTVGKEVCPGGKPNVNCTDDKLTISDFQDTHFLTYSCEDSATTHRVYVKGKVCENCIDMDATFVAGFILGDLLITGGVILIVYVVAKRKSGATAPKSANRRQPSAPPVPNADYAPLNKSTLASEAYAPLRRP